MASPSPRHVATPSDEEMSDVEESRRERDPKRARSQDREQEDLLQPEQNSSNPINNHKVCSPTWKGKLAILLLLLVPTAQAVRNGPHALEKFTTHKASLWVWSQVTAPDVDEEEKDAPEGYIILEQLLYEQRNSKFFMPKSEIMIGFAKMALEANVDVPDT